MRNEAGEVTYFSAKASSHIFHAFIWKRTVDGSLLDLLHERLSHTRGK